MATASSQATLSPPVHVGGSLGLAERLRRLWDRTVGLTFNRFEERVLLKREFERLHLAIGGHIFFQTLAAAVRFDLFGLLTKHGSLTRAQIAQELGIAEQPARILLLGCTSLGLLRKSGESYRNSVLAQRLLSRESPESVVSYVEFEQYIIYKPMFWLYDALRENRNVGLKEISGEEPTLYQRLAHNPELERLFQDAMSALSVQANEHLARYIDFSSVQHVVDVGGGDGTNVIELARHWPNLRATVFDSPTVSEIARTNIERSGLSDRLDAVAGNCFEDEFPTGVDCILFAHFFTIWTEE
jgi:hypothetical protein